MRDVSPLPREVFLEIFCFQLLINITNALVVLLVYLCCSDSFLKCCFILMQISKRTDPPDLKRLDFDNVFRDVCPTQSLHYSDYFYKKDLVKRQALQYLVFGLFFAFKFD